MPQISNNRKGSQGDFAQKGVSEGEILEGPKKGGKDGSRNRVGSGGTKGQATHHKKKPVPGSLKSYWGFVQTTYIAHALEENHNYRATE